MKLRPRPSSGGLLLWMKTLLQLFAAKFESAETREFKKLKRFIAG